MAASEAKKDSAAKLKAAEIKQKEEAFDKRKQNASYFGSSMVSSILFAIFNLFDSKM